MKLSVQQLAHKLIAEGLATEESFIGCSDREIEQLEKKHQTILSDSFKEFLATMGKRRGRFFAECDFAVVDLCVNELNQQCDHQKPGRFLSFSYGRFYL